MNLILFEQSEVSPDIGSDGAFTVTVSKTDRRYIHCSTILKVVSGSHCRVGILDGKMYNALVGELTSDFLTFKFDSTMIRDSTTFADLNISLILAMPRPKVLDRLLPVFGQLGFRRVMLINADRVETSYFSSHLTQEHNFRPKLIKGLEQASVTTHVPEVSIDKRPLDVFINKRLDIAFPPEKTNRFICHPEDDVGPISDGLKNFDISKETVIALGPEGGWLDFEIDMLKQKGFIPVTCSSRVFTTDVAIIALTAAISSRLNPKILGGQI
jgi:16S rRNA (uracil1498-N3)-methyltransferase